jgi:thioredoxin-related protein
MKRIIFSTLLILGLFTAVYSQEKKEVHIYNPLADAKADIKAAVAKADKEGKNVLLQFGGNWCIWCIYFHDKLAVNDTMRTALNDNFIPVLVNWSPENKNEAILAEYGHPERFGFPVFVVLDNKGKLLHIQDSAYLEEGKGHSTKKVVNFFKQWSPKAIDPKTYAKKPATASSGK